MTAPRHHQTNAGLALIGSAAAVVLSALSLPVYAEYAGGPEIDTLRTPLIPGASWQVPYVPAPEGQPPPIGDGPVPEPVTPGHLGGPMPPPTQVPMPPVGPMDKHIVNAYAAPYLVPPPSTPGPDPGMLPGVNGFIPPAEIVDVQQGGGLSGNPPVVRWGGQTTQDFGRPKNSGSLTTDFGQNISTLAGVPQRSISEDGPRPAVHPGRMGADTNRQQNLAGAQETNVEHGNRVMFKGANLRSRLTIAPY